ncbi:MAG TPA: hypothetical protein VMV18_15955, partial [bacterium]|nr:hypothetical protein [bacterium]
MKKLVVLGLSSAVLALAAACGTTTNGATASPTPTSSLPPTSPTPTPSGYAATTVHDIQTGTETATKVEVDDVVVTAIMPVKSGISFWVQDAGGGQFSGVLVYDLHGTTPTSLAVGDVVTVQGSHDEFAGTGTTPWASTQTEIVPDTVTVTDHSTPTVDLLPDPS